MLDSTYVKGEHGYMRVAMVDELDYFHCSFSRSV